jgi:hypothetical protein
MPRPTDRPDIEIGAAVKARKLRFKEVPETEVRFSDGSRPVSERTNLPDEVEPGVTYRDVEVKWHAQSRVTEQWSDEEVRKTNGRSKS